jgi:hypothetical protein
MQTSAEPLRRRPGKTRTHEGRHGPTAHPDGEGGRPGNSGSGSCDTFSIGRWWSPLATPMVPTSADRGVVGLPARVGGRAGAEHVLAIRCGVPCDRGWLRSVLRPSAGGGRPERLCRPRQRASARGPLVRSEPSQGTDAQTVGQDTSVTATVASSSNLGRAAGSVCAGPVRASRSSSAVERQELILPGKGAE